MCARYSFITELRKPVRRIHRRIAGSVVWRSRSTQWIRPHPSTTAASAQISDSASSAPLANATAAYSVNSSWAPSVRSMPAVSPTPATPSNAIPSLTGPRSVAVAASQRPTRCTPSRVGPSSISRSIIGSARPRMFSGQFESSSVSRCSRGSAAASATSSASRCASASASAPPWCPSTPSSAPGAQRSLVGSGSSSGRTTSSGRRPRSSTRAARKA